MELRELTAADLPALAELCRRSLDEPLDQPLLRRLFLGDPGFTPAYHLGLEQGGALAGAILGSLRERQAGRVGGARLLVVAPELRRRGLGGRLLGELERRMAADGLAELHMGGLAPNYVWPGLEVQRYTPAYCFLERHGYARSGDAVNMELELAARDWAAELVALPLRDGWAVRRATPADRDLATTWVRERWSPPWLFETELAFAAPQPTIMLALRDGEVGGFACWDVSGLWGTFGPTGTAEELRGQGLGKALLLACFAAMRAQGYARAEIGWTGPLAFYARAADARMGRICWFMTKRLAG
jgi:GNAT superfamily N-acetyltransferase